MATYYSNTATTASSTTSTWCSWNETATSAAHNHVWVVWNSDTTQTTGSTHPSVWCTWNQQQRYAEYRYRQEIERQQVSQTWNQQWVTWNGEVERRKSRRARSRGNQRSNERQNRKHDRKILTSEEKAKRLLLDMIGEDQLKIYEETGRLFIKGRKHDYIIQREGGVKRIEKDKIVDLCIHLEDQHQYPKTDNVIALKLMLEADEKNFNKVANEHRNTPRPAELPRCANG